MKRVLFMTVMVAIILFFGCDGFSTSYERIDDREFRLLDFIYDPVEIAPGDSFMLIAVFAGKDMIANNIDIDWQISFDVSTNIFGETAVVDSIPIDSVADRVNSFFSANTQTVAFRIKIPNDIIRASSAIPHNWVNMLPSSIRGMVPREYADLTKDEVVDIIDSLADNWNGNVDIEGGEEVLRTLLQFFTVPIRISARLIDPGSKFERGHTIISTHSVRYNRRFLPVTTINTNPIIDDVVVYKVRGDIDNFDDKSGRDYETILLDNSGTDSIIIENGFSYFLDARSENRDVMWSFDGNLITERHRIFRHFQLGGENFHEVDHTKYLTIDNSTGKIGVPDDRRITEFTFWTTVTDEILNVRLHPQGSALAEVSGRFVYR